MKKYLGMFSFFAFIAWAQAYENVALNKVSTAYTTTDHIIYPEITDGSLTDNSWYVYTKTKHPAAVEVDLQGPHLVNKVIFHHGIGSYSTGLIPDIRVFYHDGYCWVSAPGATLTNNTSKSPVINFSTPVLAGKILVHAQLPTNGRVYVREVEVYGEPSTEQLAARNGQCPQGGHVVERTPMYDSAVHYPPTYNEDPSRRYPLIISMHGIGGNILNADHTAILSGPEGFAKQFAQKSSVMKNYEAIVVSPHCRGFGETSNCWFNEAAIRGLIARYKRSHLVDPNKIWLTGLSGGGITAISMANKTPQEFAGIIPIASKGSQHCGMKYMHIYHLNGSNDTSFPGSSAVDAKKAMDSCAPTNESYYRAEIIAGGTHSGSTWDVAYSKLDVQNFMILNSHHLKNTPGGGGVIIPPAVNIPPSVSAGSDRTITLPTHQLDLIASATDTDGTVASYAWTKVSGGAATLSGSTSATLKLSGLVEGTYVFRVTVKDDKGAAATDDVSVVVKPAVVSPAASCGEGGGKITREFFKDLIGSSTSMIEAGQNPIISELTSFEGPSNIGDNYGNRVRGFFCAPYSGAYKFLVSGDDHTQLFLSTDTNPSNKIKIAEVIGYTGVRQFDKMASQASASISLIAGRKYYVELLHKESSGNDHFAVKMILPNGQEELPISGARLYPMTVAANVLPIVNAGADISIQLPENKLILIASASDADGTISSYTWSKLSGPAASLAGLNSNTLAVSGLVEGIYVFNVSVTDSRGGVAADTVEVKVLPAVVNPVFEVNNLALGKPATSDSVFSNSTISPSTFAPGKAFDDVIHPENGRFCSSNGATHWLEVDLTVAKTISQIKLFHGKSGDFPVIDFQLQVKLNSSDAWKTVATVKDNSSLETSHSFPAESARFVRLLSTKNKDSYLRVREMQVMGH